MKTHLLSFFLFLSPVFGFACSCLYTTNFCEAMTPSSNVAGVQVLTTYLVDIGGINEQYVDAVVIDNLQGETPADTLSFRVAGGTSCGIGTNLTAYQPGDTLIVFANYELTEKPNGHSTFGIDGVCSQGFLMVNRGTATVDYQDFKSNISDCSLMTKTVERELLDEVTFLFPNPTTNDLKIAVDMPLDLTVQIFATDGRLIEDVNLNRERLKTLEVADYAAGVYYVRFATEEVAITKRFVKISN